MLTKFPKNQRLLAMLLIKCLNFNFLYYKMGNVNQCPKGISLEIIFRNILLEE